MTTRATGRSRQSATAPILTYQRVIGVAVLLALLLIIWWVGSWLLKRHRVEWSIDQGLAMLDEAATADEFPAQLARWEQSTSRYWNSRRDAMITRLFSNHDLADQRVRALLEAISGVNYGDREDDWRRWYANRDRLARGLQPRAPRREAVELEPLWQASVGLTSWFSTILPIDGQIYVASLGTTLARVDDPWDGVVRVDAETHRGQLIFEAPDRYPRDVIGLALGNNGLFAACRNGFVYAIDPDGTMQWRCNTVHPSVSVPLALDVNGDDVSDVVVVTERGTVVAISGRNGKTPWVTPLPGGPTTHLSAPPLVQATLSAGDVLPGGGPEIVVTTEAGDVYVLTVRTGRVLWHRRFMPGQYAAAITYNDLGDNQTAVFLGDSSARIWRLVRSGNGLEPDLLRPLAVRPGHGIVAHLRTMYTADDAASWLLACPTGDTGAPGGSVCLLEAFGLRWRYAPGGVIWAPPAVADVNADGGSEILVTSVEFPADGEPTSLLSILSRDGHCLHRVDIPSAIEAAPVVADINGDARLEILVADQAGILRCYATRGRGRAVEWGLGTGDPCNTHNALNAFSWGQRLGGLQWTWRPEF